MIPWLVAADDRTGALEVAGACAATWGPVRVAPWHPDEGAQGAAVTDLSSRHLASHDAARLAASVDAVPARRVAHKIDSTLRGNWAHELVARTGSGRRALLVPAFPALGRTCRDGVVFDGDAPAARGAAGSDPRGSVRSSRPADHLRGAGAGLVVELVGAGEVSAWLGAAHEGIAVCDAATDADLVAVAEAWARSDGVLFAGTSASIGAAAAAAAGSAEGAPVRPSPPIDHPVLVVCGSLHPMAVSQVSQLLDDPAIHVLRPASPPRATISHAAAAAAAAELGRSARAALRDRPVRTLVLIGGDTASAVLGDAPISVGGLLAPGIAYGRDTAGSGPLVITKAGGFGQPSTLRQLLADVVR